ncbi:MAG TPA: DUF2071 domain-containing protein [Candidatus Saccharimonadales bacterium]|jgi:uncharacterized protein YqjF (DUF2071 family)|nr:DUF2071 domain-containing protein [Candidatus Saccharimonadales bacterium]
MTSSRAFLTAEWRMLAMLNYEVDAGLLSRFVPADTELDLWRGKLFVSLVGFRFLNTRVLGIPIPGHRNFDEVNLRFYVRRREGQEIRRGVVFIREIVPRWAIAAVARTVYNERYVALPMRHQIEHQRVPGPAVEYGWRTRRARWSRISIKVAGDPALPQEGSEEQFITEHYWGYAAQRNGGCVEYRVEHPPWKVWSAQEASFEGDVEELYGKDFVAVLSRPPASAFLAEGSEVTVGRGKVVGK